MSVFTSTKKFNSTKLIFKIHPFRNNPRYLKILKKYDKKFWEIRNESLSLLSQKVDVVISSFDSSAFLDGLYSKNQVLSFLEAIIIKELFQRFLFIKLQEYLLV